MRTSRLGWPLLIAAIVVVTDQLTKHWALNALADGHTIDLVWTLRFNLAFNTGMAFSQADGLGPLIGIVAVVVVAVLLVSLRRTGGRWTMFAVGMVAGGAIGNVVDRLFRGDGWMGGAVVDFIDPQWFPIFNIADIGVTVGGVLLVLCYLATPEETADDRAGTDGSDASDTDDVTHEHD